MTLAPLIVSAPEAADHGLPPVAIRMDTTGCGMVPTRPAAGVYVWLTGPPGAPLAFGVRLRESHGGRQVSLAEQVKRLEASTTDLRFGPEGKVKVAGAELDAILYFAGQSHASRAVCLFGVDAGPVGIVVELTVSAHYRSVEVPASVATQPNFRKILATFEASYEPPVKRRA